MDKHRFRLLPRYPAIVLLCVLLVCLAATMIAEAVFTRLRSRPIELDNMSAVVTGVILGLSLPASSVEDIALNL